MQVWGNGNVVLLSAPYGYATFYSCGVVFLFVYGGMSYVNTIRKGISVYIGNTQYIKHVYYVLCKWYNVLYVLCYL